MSDNQIDHRGASHLAEIMQSLPHLEVLNLSGNKIGDEGAMALTESLTHPESKLTELNVVRNSIGDKGIEAFTQALPRNYQIKMLNLVFNSRITSAGFQRLVDLTQADARWKLEYEVFPCRDVFYSLLRVVA